MGEESSSGNQKAPPKDLVDLVRGDTDGAPPPTIDTTVATLGPAGEVERIARQHLSRTLAVRARLNEQLKSLEWYGVTSPQRVALEHN